MPEVRCTRGHMLATPTSSDAATTQKWSVVTQELQIVRVVVEIFPETFGIEQLLPNLHRTRRSNHSFGYTPRHVVRAVPEGLHRPGCHRLKYGNDCINIRTIDATGRGRCHALREKSLEYRIERVRRCGLYDKCHGGTDFACAAGASTVAGGACDDDDGDRW